MSENSPLAPFVVPPQVWRDGKAVMMRLGARFPDRCVKCNVAVDEPAVRVRLWSKPSSIWNQDRRGGVEIDPNDLLADWAVLRTVFGALFGKLPVIEVKLCARHRAWARVCWLLMLLGLLWFVCYEGRVLFLYGRGAFNWHTLGLVVLGAAAFMFSRTLWAENNSSDPIRLHGACEAFRNSLPPAPNE
jgi:hypothetical protein